MHKVFLHIGMCKTGTTACQYLFDERQAALREAGLLYASTGLFDRHHYNLAQAFLAGRNVPGNERRTLFRDLHREIRTADMPVLLSSEHFSDATETDIQTIARYFGYGGTVIVALRQQVSWASAMYAEAIRWGNRISFSDYLETSRETFDFRSFLRRWEDGFGQENVNVVIYDRHPTDIVGQVLQTTGISRAAIDRLGPAERAHTTFPAPLVHMQREFSDGQPNGFALEPGLRIMEDEAIRTAVRIPKQWQIPPEYEDMFLSLEAGNEEIARDYGLPTPLFGRTMADFLHENHTQGYSGKSLGWLVSGLAAAQ